MLYKKYRLYGERMEIMIPSYLKLTDSFGSSQYHWASDDGKTVINVARGSADMAAEDLRLRLNEYYKSFRRDVAQFECRHIAGRRINGQAFGEIRYSSRMTGYCFYTVFLLGSYEDREFIVTIQCLDDDMAENARIFENISDSLRLLGKDREDEGHDCQDER